MLSRKIYTIIFTIILLVSIWIFIFVRIYGNARSQENNVVTESVQESTWELVSESSTGKTLSEFDKQLLLSTYYKQIISWNRIDAINTYKKLLIYTNESDEFSWKQYIENDKFEMVDKLKSEIMNIPPTSRQEKIDKMIKLGWIYYEIGDSLYYSWENQARYSNAIIYYYLLSVLQYDEVILLNPNSSEWHRMKGVVLLDIGTNQKEAEQELKTAINLDQSDYYAYYKLWNLYWYNNDNPQRIAYYKSGIIANPNFELLYNNLILAYANTNNLEGQEETFLQFLKICKNYCHLAYYNYWNGLSDKDKKIDLYIKAIDFAKTQWETYRFAYLALGKQYYFKWDYDRAILALYASLNKEWEYPKHNNSFINNDNEDISYLYLTKAYIIQNNNTKAGELLVEWLNKYPKSTALLEFFNSLPKK